MLPLSVAHHKPVRARLLAAFLWLAVVCWAIGLGAKIFDLLVLSSAWGAAPPASFDRLPYGKDYPVDPGRFFQPLSAAILLCSLGALVCGWRTPLSRALWVAVGSFTVIWILTPTVFWPMIGDLWAVHKGRLAGGDAEAAAMVRRWVAWDCVRIALIATGFVSCVQAMVGGAAKERATTASFGNFEEDKGFP